MGAQTETDFCPPARVADSPEKGAKRPAAELTSTSVTSSRIKRGKSQSGRDVESLLARFPRIAQLPTLVDMDTEIPQLEESVTHGTMPNGFQYFVKKNREPRERIDLNLVVGFGSLVETEEQRGIAHIIEHLAFSATKNFENHQIIKFLENIGAPFGACQNAYTSFDETVYQLHVDRKYFKEALKVLNEFAFHIRIAQDDIEKERNVVLDEWRASRNANFRVQEQYFKELTAGSLYGDRLPIGLESVIKTCDKNMLRSFYEKFYHPERMCICICGDFEEGTDEIVEHLTELFGSFKRDGPAPERPIVTPDENAAVKVITGTDKELMNSAVTVDCRRARVPPPKSIGDHKLVMIEQTFHEVLRSRLFKKMLEQAGDKILFSVDTSTENPIKTLTCANVSIVPAHNKTLEAIKMTLREIERVKQHGFHQSELDRAVRSELAEMEEAYIEKDQIDNTEYVQEMNDKFLHCMPMPGTTFECTCGKSLVPRITLEEINAVAQRYDFTKNCLIQVKVPKVSAWNPFTWLKGSSLPSEEDIRRAVRDVCAMLFGQSASLIVGIVRSSPFVRLVVFNAKP